VIRPPRNFRARPTTDMAREALFNILENHFDLQTLSVLDLFSGTGSISYEFASRDTPVIHLVEQNPVHFRFILKTIEELHFDNIHGYRRDVFSFLKLCINRYDLIFADPPFVLRDIEHLPDLILNSGILNPEGWFILEHSGKYSFSHNPGFLMEKRYGQIHFSFFLKLPAEGHAEKKA